MKENDIAEILTSTRTIALVGASDKPDRPSYRVMKYLLEHYADASLSYNQLPSVMPDEETMQSFLGWCWLQ